ncbi:MAG TPA: cysteine--tRNA ligase, partial [Chromatiaceae bacterium]|nr:cysteine--tRNA ligase [Chromatiaceae bacterium]
FLNNITDIDDKIIKRAAEEGISTAELAEKFSRYYFQNMYSLGVKPANIYPRATAHITDIIMLIEKLIENGHAYVSNGSVYFDVASFKEYGKLSNLKPEEMVTAVRINIEEGKRNPQDFVLWKSAKPGEPWWPSPWGRGRPGWHIECSAMSMKYLGKQLDIHGGGQDLIFPHHENEIAQSEGYTGTRFVKYWMHVGLVTINNVEMSKSIGNVIPLKETIEKYGSDTLRIMYFTTHYRSPLEYSEEKIAEAKRIAERIRNTYMEINKINIDELRGSNRIKKVEIYRRRIMEALDNDLNTPLAISIVLSFIKWVNKILNNKDLDKETYHEIKRLMDDIKYIFGLRLESPRQRMDMVDSLLKIIIDIRRRLDR